jgi:hypothetical protein
MEVGKLTIRQNSDYEYPDLRSLAAVVVWQRGQGPFNQARNAARRETQGGNTETVPLYF